jgi:hypothetical protein
MEDTNITGQSMHASGGFGALNSFNKDRSPGPDGWTVEFFLHFFDLVGTDLLDLVEESRLRGRIIGTLNSTFLTLIPKENNPSTFGDYRTIALCNLCYKLITKIIANRIKPILSRTLSGEQLGFLKGRQILDAIGTTQECLHNIKAKKSKALILKLDLKKAFDCIDWDFLRLILTQSGFSQSSIRWIMCGSDNCKFFSPGEWRNFPLLSQWQRFEAGLPTLPIIVHTGHGRPITTSKK